MSARNSPWTDKVYRFHIEHLLADESEAYLTQTHGPYTTLAAARGQATRLLNEAQWGSKKARAVIEVSSLDWHAL